jgi:hypothetical protein
MRIFLRFLLVVCAFGPGLGVVAATPKLEATPTQNAIAPADAAAVGRMLCEAIRLDHPGMEAVKAAAKQGDYARALSAWRDQKIQIFRQCNPGTFGWHANQLNPGSTLNYARFMTGRISKNDFLKSSCDPDFVLFDFSTKTGKNNGETSVNWLAKKADGSYPQDAYNTFAYIIPLASFYYKDGDPAFLEKWFQVTADFARRQKALVEKLPAAEQKKIVCNWTAMSGSALTQSGRVQNIVRAFAVICKSLPGGEKPAAWASVNLPVSGVLPKASCEMVPAVELAWISLSLVRDHPQALLDACEKAGKVPNQRRSGLTALLFIAALFPEFKGMDELRQKTEVAIDDYLDGAFFKDGGMLEPSFNYNVGDARELSQMIDFLTPLNPALARRVKSRQTAFYRMTAALLTPLGKLPALASNYPENPPAAWQRDKKFPQTLLTYLNKMEIPGADDPVVAQIAAHFNSGAGASNNAVTAPRAPDDFGSIAFPYSGYYVQRSHWNWDAHYLFFQNIRPSRGHYNLGNNAIQISAFGRPLLQTAGPPIYSERFLPQGLRADAANIEKFFSEESSYKMNTVVVDMRHQNRGAIAQTAYTTPINSRWLATPEFDFVEGFFALGYKGLRESVTHRRQVIFVRERGFWIVADILSNPAGGAGKQTHTYSQIWNFPGWQAGGPKTAFSHGTAANGFKKDELRIEPGVGFRTTDPSGPNLRLYHFSATPVSYRHFYAQKNPWFGWFSPGLGNPIPAHQVFADWQGGAGADAGAGAGAGAGDSVLVTVLWPVREGEAPAFSSLQNRSDGPDSAGFAMTFPDGGKLEYRIGGGGGEGSGAERKLSCAGETREAQSLLVLREAGGRARVLRTGGAGAKAFVVAE